MTDNPLESGIIDQLDSLIKQLRRQYSSFTKQVIDPRLQSAIEQQHADYLQHMEDTLSAICVIKKGINETWPDEKLNLLLVSLIHMVRARLTTATIADRTAAKAAKRELVSLVPLEQVNDSSEAEGSLQYFSFNKKTTDELDRAVRQVIIDTSPLSTEYQILLGHLKQYNNEAADSSIKVSKRNFILAIQNAANAALTAIQETDEERGKGLLSISGNADVDVLHEVMTDLDDIVLAQLSNATPEQKNRGLESSTQLISILERSKSNRDLQKAIGIAMVALSCLLVVSFFTLVAVYPAITPMLVKGVLRLPPLAVALAGVGAVMAIYTPVVLGVGGSKILEASKDTYHGKLFDHAKKVSQSIKTINPKSEGGKSVDMELREIKKN